MGLGQMSFYCTAAAGSKRARGSKKAPRSGRIVDFMRRMKERVAQFFELHGIPTIFGLSLVPNPLTTFASITAGSLGMGFRRFLPMPAHMAAREMTEPARVMTSTPG